MGDALKDLMVSLIALPLALMALYGVLRRGGRQWWIWGALVTRRVDDRRRRDRPGLHRAASSTPTRRSSRARFGTTILRLAHANGIRAQEVYEVDASRQTTRVSANVSGILGTERITLNDNLLSRASPEAIQAVLGHEMGHYVLNHVYKLLLAFGVIVVVGFALDCLVRSIGWPPDVLPGGASAASTIRPACR